MPGLSVSATQIQAVITDQGFPVLAEAYAAQPVLYTSVAEVIGNEQASNPFFGDISTTLLGMARPVEIEHGQDMPAASLEMGFTPQGKIRKFARSITFTREQIAAAGGNVNNLVMRSVNDLFPQFAQVFVAQSDQIVADMFNNGALTAGDASAFKNNFSGHMTATDGFIYDGLPWFDTAHPQSPSVTGTTYSNHSASLDLTTDNLQTALIALQSTNAKNGRGDRIVNRADTLLVPSGLEYTARTIVESTQKAGTANNDANVLPPLNVVVHPYLTDTDGWFVGRRGAGMRVIDSGLPQFEVTENAYNGTVTVLVYKYFGAYIRDWRPWYAANVAP